MSYFTAIVTYRTRNVVNVYAERVTVQASDSSAARDAILAHGQTRGKGVKVGPVRPGF